MLHIDVITLSGYFHTSNRTTFEFISQNWMNGKKKTKKNRHTEDSTPLIRMLVLFKDDRIWRCLFIMCKDLIKCTKKGSNH